MTGDRSVEKDLPCCNIIEPDGIPCSGTMRAGYPEYVCGTCGGRCGALAHPYDCVIPAAVTKPGDDQ